MKKELMVEIGFKNLHILFANTIFADAITLVEGIKHF